MRRALALSAVLLAFAPAAFAQDPEDEPVDDEPAIEETIPDGSESEESTPRGCERGPGTDADYAYCPDRCAEPIQGDDAYYGCAYPSSGTPTPPRTKPRAETAAAVQPLAVQQTLPMTGGEPWLIAACGAGFLLAGTGMRIRFRPR